MRHALAVAGIAAATLGLAGCSSSGSSARSSDSDKPTTFSSLTTAEPTGAVTATDDGASEASTVPLNPVRLLKKVTGCKIPVGVTAGRVDVLGGKFADCTMQGGKIEVESRCYTADTLAQGMKLGQAADGSVDDRKFILVGADSCLVEVSNAYADPLPTSVALSVAKDVGGKYLPPEG